MKILFLFQIFCPDNRLTLDDAFIKLINEADDSCV